jgi:hypothetical protein
MLKDLVALPITTAAQGLSGLPQVCGYFYRCGPDHTVWVDPRSARCSCGKADCPAIFNVLAYLASGGTPAPEAPPGFFPVLPTSCPICGSGVVADTTLNSGHRGLGWRCSEFGQLHYWRTLGAFHKDRVRCDCSAYSVLHRRGAGACTKKAVHPGDAAADPLNAQPEIPD